MIALVCDCGQLITDAVNPATLSVYVIAHHERQGCLTHAETMTFICDCGQRRLIGPGLTPNASFEEGVDAAKTDLQWLYEHLSCVARPVS